MILNFKQVVACLVVWLQVSTLVLAFNFDLNWPVLKTISSYRKSTVDSYFGYSVAQHIVKTSKTPYILVGAPRDSTQFNGKFFNMSGAVYKCPVSLSRNDDCDQLNVDFKSKKSDEYSEQGLFLDDDLKEQFMGRIFDNQWFGVSLASTGEGSFSACAHKYVHYYNFTRQDEHAAYGACYRFSNDFSQEYKHVPCLVYSYAVNTFSYNNYAYCQAGTSLSMVEDTSLQPSNAQEVYLSYGMPGALNFRGLVGVKAIGKNSVTEYLYKNKSYCKFNKETDRPQPEGYCPSLWNKYSYLGMSHALIRKYQNNNKIFLVATGSPRDSLHGIVRFFTIMFDVSFGQVTKHLDLKLTGPHKGSYFGFSMVAVDLNGDKLDDLIVGAPYYSRKYEPNVGAIYIYQNFKNKGFSNSHAINFTGEIRSLFGHAISSIGDMDKDGYNDFAVGAPYELNPSKKEEANSNTGAIYIFRGNQNIENIKLSQKIFASDVKVPVGLVNSISSFGYSLSGGLDMDESGYPDLLVGSLKSDLVILLRTLPVVYVDSFVNKVENLEEIDQKRKECKQDENSIENDLVCFNFELCFQLNEKTQLQSVNRVQMLEYKLEAEPNQTYSRVYFDSNSNSLNSSIRLNINFKKSCTQINAYIRKDNSDYIRPIKFLVNYKLATNFNDALSVGAANDLNYIKNYPVIHEDSNKLEFEANFKKDCGPDKKCLTDLKLNAYFVNLMIGEDNVPLLSFKESDAVTIAVILENNGRRAEPAYATQLTIDFDERLDFIKKLDLESNGFSCAINYKVKANSLICKMASDIEGIPFGINSSAKFNLTFSSTRLYKYANISIEPNILFKLEAKTLSVDTNLDNNNIVLLAKVKVRANLYLYGTKSPEQVFYSDKSIIRGESSMKNLDQIGPIIEHTYKINNGGPFSVNFFQLIVDWPYESRLVDFDPVTNDKFQDQGKHLLYLTEKPTKIPNDHPITVVCSSYIVDPLKLSELRNSLRKRRSLEEGDGFRKKSRLTDNSARVAAIDCFTNTAYCYKINCSFYGDFSKDETISLKFTARLWNSTLVEDFANYEKVLIKSHAKIALSDGIHDDRPNDNENSVATVAYSKIVIKVEKALPLWLYALSVLIGLVILVVCIIGFWMLGFFERKKFGDEKYVLENEKVRKTPY